LTMNDAATAKEVNFDGLVGPTHNFSGLSFGNVASRDHGGQQSSPRQAALQGLAKMKAVRRMGLPQAVLPPQERPHIPTLRRLGFHGTEAQVLHTVAASAPHLLSAASSASCMWVANAATVSPFADCADGKTHFTPANLMSMFHRSIEPPITSKILRSIFSGDDFVHHDPLPASATFSDEGAANHTRFCGNYGEQGVELFVYGASVAAPEIAPAKFPARQTLEAFQAIARSHGIAADKAVFAQQNPAAIDAGVFHNDVIAVGNRNILFFHEQAFLDSNQLKNSLDLAMAGQAMEYIEVPAAAVTLEDAVKSYLFNSQLLSLPDTEGTTIVVPLECAENSRVKRYLDGLEAGDNSVKKVVYLDLRESMSNGGGPACLRLRVVLTEAQIVGMRARVFLDDDLELALETWIKAHYRETLWPQDLADPKLLSEVRTALDELTDILNLGSIYDFQA
jgi:succinylarginine dihydrolase